MILANLKPAREFRSFSASSFAFIVRKIINLIFSAICRKVLVSPQLSAPRPLVQRVARTEGETLLLPILAEAAVLHFSGAESEVSSTRLVLGRNEISPCGKGLSVSSRHCRGASPQHPGLPLI